MLPRLAAFEIVSGWVEDVGCAPKQIALRGQLELDSPFPRVRTNYGAVSMGYARVWQAPEGSVITAIGMDSVVTVNGAPVHRAVLKPGDLIIWGDVTLRYVELGARENREPHLEAAINAAPDDEACWQVYADWLMTVGDPLAERIRSAATDLPAQLEPLVSEHGMLTLDWSHGFIRSALLRAWGAVQLDELLIMLLQLPEARLLRSLEVELRSFVTRQDGADRLKQVLEHAQSVLGNAHLPALERLVLGPLFVPPERELAEIVRPGRAPRLSPPGPDGFLLVKTSAWLEIERGLEPRGPLQPGERVQLYENPRVHVGSVGWNEGWTLFATAPDNLHEPIRLNGKEPNIWSELRDGDLIEAGEWLRMRFRT